MVNFLSHSRFSFFHPLIAFLGGVVSAGEWFIELYEISLTYRFDQTDAIMVSLIFTGTGFLLLWINSLKVEWRGVNKKFEELIPFLSVTGGPTMGGTAAARGSMVAKSSEDEGREKTINENRKRQKHVEVDRKFRVKKRKDEN